MHRFFVSPEALATQPVLLTGGQAHQVRRVLRLRLGDRVVLLDGHGRAYEAMLIALGETDARFQLVRQWEAAGEPFVHITLFQAVLKGERFSWALQKGTEVGISRFVPIICERNVVDDLDAAEAKRERWERVIQEAAEQCGRARLPELAPACLFAQAVAAPCDIDAVRQGSAETARLLAWEGEHNRRLGDALASCNLVDGTRIELFVGPEGGFVDEEVRLAQRYGVQPVNLGRRILRAETAGVVAAAAILYAAGEL